MTDAVIVSTARTPIGKAYRGAFNNTHGATLAGHAIRNAVERAGIEPGEVEDVLIGCALPEGATGENIARQAAIRAGLPVTTSGATVNRFCSSGMQTIALAAQRVIVDNVPVMVAGGVESVSLVQNEHKNKHRLHDEWLDQHKPEIYLPMIDTAEVVAKRYKISREAQDQYALQSQLRTAAAQQAGRFDDEIVPLPTTKLVQDKATGDISEQAVTLARDEGNRPDTSPEGLAKLEPVRGPGAFITAGNASQLSDGASACVVMNGKLAEKRGLSPLGIFRGLSVAGCEPDEMGIGPIYAVPRQARHPERHAQRRRRRGRDRPPLRHERRPHGRPRPHRGQAPRRQVRRLHDVRRRRHGRRRAVRGGVIPPRRGEWRAKRCRVGESPSPAALPHPARASPESALPFGEGLSIALGRRS
jgi:acetyl-CoA C-acetyltransferase